LAEVSQSSEQQDLRSPAATQAARLHSELAGNQDLIRLVERVTQTRLPWVVIPGSAITRWKRDDPAGWEKVSEWLAVHGVAIVRI
jgi:hypothetical protein